MTTPVINAIKRTIEILENDAEELKENFSNDGKDWKNTTHKDDYKERKQLASALRKAIPGG
ncbi:hypothetical protein [Undibacterium sp. TJN19]|uniref:hypothetical protein n=1 Tax=Undibacterium sp. TJN19 TaxID=3413055 RepID=UPI003BF38EB8